MKTAEEILENITCCTIEEDADLDVKSNYYYQHDDVVKAIEQAQKEAYQERQSSPKIKQLAWEVTGILYFKAKTSLGLGYSITEIKGTYIVHFGDAPISWEKSLESSKSAAQRDFEKRIKECLE